VGANDHSGARAGGRSESIDLIAKLAEMGARLQSLEAESLASKSSRVAFNDNINTLLTQMAGTVEAHGAELAEFRRAISQIARIAQVLEGAFGQAGLVGEVAQMRRDIADYNARLGELEAKLEAKLDPRGVGATTRISPAVSKGADMRDNIISLLVKVILALAALLGAGAIGSKYGGVLDPAAAPTTGK